MEGRWFQGFFFWGQQRIGRVPLQNFGEMPQNLHTKKPLLVKIALKQVETQASNKNPNKSQVRGAYRKLALKVHPDKQKDKDSVELSLGAFSFR